MTERIDFHNCLAHLRRLIIRRRLMRAGAVWLIAATSLMAALHLLSRLHPSFADPARQAWVAAIGALALACAWDRLRPINLARVFMDLDRRYDSKQLLTTAMEYQHRTDSVFAAPLLRQALHTLALLQTGELIPLRPSPAGAAAALCALMSAGLLFWLVPGSGPADGGQSAQARAAAEQILSQMQDEGLDQRGEAPPRLSDGLSEQVAQAARDVERQAMSAEQFLSLLEQTANRLEREGQRLRQALHDELWMGQETIAPELAQALEELQKAPSREAEERLREPFGGRLPDSLAQRLAQLQDIRQIAQLVEQALETAGRPFSPTPPDSGAQTGHALALQEASSPIEESQASLKEDMAAPAAGQTGDRGVSAATGADADDPARSAEDGAAAGKDGSAAAGRSGAGPQQSQAADLSGSQGPAVHEGAGQALEPRYNRHLLALPMPDQQARSPQEALQSYVQQVESVLRKEDIPESYREFIKTYFLSIDLSLGKE